MKTNSRHFSALLNILVIVFTMNAALAHSTCSMDSTGGNTEISQQSDQNTSTAMPCHTVDNLGSIEKSDPTLSQCCADCSVFSLPMDITKAIATAHSDIIITTLTATLSRTIELPFRPPITSLS